MEKKRLVLAAMVMIMTETFAQAPYPSTRKVDQADNYFGTKVSDPYRWLEDDNSEETKDWVKKQNGVTNAYLAKIPFRADVKKRLEELWNYPKYGSPFKKGKYYYYYKNDGLQNQSVLYRQNAIDAAPEVFLDPNKLSADGTAALAYIEFSKNGKYAVYAIAQSGSDWQIGYVMNAETKQLVSDKIDYIKFGSFSWKGDEGFYYSRYPKPDEKNMLVQKNEFQKVYYHKLGTSQSSDVLIWEDKQHPLRYCRADISEDQNFLFINVTEGTSGGEILYKNLIDTKQKDFKVLVPGFTTEPAVIDNYGDKVLLRTNEGAPNFKVVLVDPKNPAKENWQTIIPEQKDALQGVATAGGFLFTSYLKDASTTVFQHTYEGKLIREIGLPGIGYASGFGTDRQYKELFYTYTSFTYPPTIFHYDIASGVSTVFRKSEVKFNVDDYETKQVFVTSKDGAKVPMFLTYKKGIKLDGNNPVLLYGYGGFNIALTPSFSISNMFFVGQGGIYAQVSLRGGNEYGESWHQSGMLLNKQNVFNDMIAAAEWLIDNKYSNKNKLAVRGGSNGGLLVGAVITQRPDLFKVAIPQVGVMDMLRYQRFTVGWGWAVEYGNAEKSEADFKNLYSFSPLHNLKKGTCYPATLVTTADHDDRVVPAHSFKFAATLQECQSCDNPALIRIDSKAGHGAGKPTSKQIDEATDVWSFVMYNLGMEFRK
ncbi:prolyl oligopeptidase family serine peptidase [Pinibacter aurantiacus]|uniref:Proline-specific endopeptidase n=1 Tax=Pinibacter aurantiacus TaxID=2851599 RepID=A0A9E2W7Y1_9BACT|nr:prolyl oligopeptidase family serine peptidase [Pinibacter aurantiacus]MBV4357092.1 prolyl oligopeptidase family serine peptidase [Pinibacter aurantiacus]